MAIIQAREVFSVSASESDGSDGQSVYPETLEFDEWPEACAAMRRVISRGFVAVVARDVVESPLVQEADDGDPDLDDWPADRHVVTRKEYWQRYCADHPQFAARQRERLAEIERSDT